MVGRQITAIALVSSPEPGTADLGLLHLQPQVVALADALTDPREAGVAAVETGQAGVGFIERLWTAGKCARIRDGIRGGAERIPVLRNRTGHRV